MNPYVTPEFDVSQLVYDTTWPKREAIHIACGDGNLDEVKRLVESGVDVSARDNHGNTPIFYAIRGGQFNVVKYLLETGVSVNSSPNFNFTSLLHLAAECGDGAICEFLIEQGASVNACNTCGHTPLFFSAFRGSDVTARVLIDAGAEVNIPANYPQWTAPPFLMATRQGHVSMMKLLVSHGADPEFSDRDGMTPLHHAVFDGGLDVVHCLVATMNVSLYERNLNKESPLISAVRVRSMDIINLLIAAGYDLSREKTIFDVKGQRKMTNKSRQEIVEYLQEAALRVKTLQELCCFSVRRLLKERGNMSLETPVDTLPIPGKLKNYILLAHLAPRS